MSKFAENVIKFAYENRANAMIAAKQAAEEGRLQKMMNWLNDPANKGKATAIESGLGGLAAGGLGYGLTKALGGSNKWAWANAGMAGGGAAAGIAGTKYRKEIGDALRNITTSRLSDKEIKDWETVLNAQPNNGTDPKLNSFKQMIAQAKGGNLPKEAVRYLRDQMNNGGWTMPADWMEKKMTSEYNARKDSTTGKEYIGDAPDNVPAPESTSIPGDQRKGGFTQGWADENNLSNLEQELAATMKEPKGDFAREQKIKSLKWLINDLKKRLGK